MGSTMVSSSVLMVKDTTETVSPSPPPSFPPNFCSSHLNTPPWSNSYPSSLNFTWLLPTFLMFAHHPKVTGSCQGGLLLCRSQGADSQWRVSFMPVHLESFRESGHLHTSLLPSFLLLLPSQPCQGPVQLLVHNMVWLKTNLFLQGFSSKTGQDSLQAAQRLVLLQTKPSNTAGHCIDLFIISSQMNSPILITSHGIQSARKRPLSSTGGTFKIHRKLFCLCVYATKPENTNKYKFLFCYFYLLHLLFLFK